MSYPRRSSRPSSAASHSSRTSASAHSDHELKLECKAIFLSHYDDIRDEIQSKQDLIELLQESGRNASNKVISKYWTRNTDSMTFDDFLDVCRREPVTSEDDLMRAFRKIDLNGDGYISLDELFKIMTTRGEKMSKAEVREMIDEVDENKDGKLDYKEFSRMVISSAEDYKKISIRMMEKKEKRGLRKRDGDITPRKEKDELSLGSQASLRSAASDNKRYRRQRSSSSNKYFNDENEGPRRGSQYSTHSSMSRRKNGEDMGWEADNFLECQFSRQSSQMTDASMPILHGRRSPSRLSFADEIDGPSPSRRSSKQPLANSLDGGDDDNVDLGPNFFHRGESRQSVQSNATAGHRRTSYEPYQERRESKYSIHSHIINEPSQERRESKHSVYSHVTHASTSAENVERRPSKHSLAPDTMNAPSAGLTRSGSRQSLLSNASNRLTDPSQERRGSRQSVRSHATDASTSHAEHRASRHSLAHDAMDVPGVGLSRSNSRQSLLSNAANGNDDDVTRPSPRGGRRESRPKSASKSGRSMEPSSLREWTGMHSKGTFFLDEDGGIISHVYSLHLTEDTEVYITIQPLKIGESGESLDGTIIDTALFVLNEDDNSYVAFTENRDSRGKYSLRCNLSMGTYTLIPFTTGCRLRPRRDMPTKEAKLINTDKDGKIVLTRAFRKGLEEIFEMADLDGNGLLSRDEFNWYNMRTSGEEVGDDEWQVVEDNIELEKGELTRSGFIKLNEMEADDNEGDTDDLWVTMTSMGFNKSLILDEACPFQLKVYAQDCPDPELKVTALESSKDKIANAVCDLAIAKGEAIKVKGMKDLTMYQYVNDHRAIIVVENKSKSRVKMQLDCGKRRGLVSHTGSLVATITVPPQSSVVGHHILPLDDRGEFTVVCEETILK